MNNIKENEIPDNKEPCESIDSISSIPNKPTNVSDKHPRTVSKTLI